jgi:predicted dehydrogenase
MPVKNTIGIGMIGHAFMGKAHSIGYRAISVIAPPKVPRPRLVAVCGRDPARTEDARERYGWERAEQDWRRLIADPDIQLIDNVGPNLAHVEPMIAAAKAGKHVYCEKPLAPTAPLAFDMWQAAEDARVKHMCAFNYRFFPALQMAREIIRSGELGTIHHYRSNFLLSSALGERRAKSWRDDAAAAGSGALGDLGSHHIDISRFLLGSDPLRASGVTRIAVPSSTDGGSIETDDLFAAILEYENGAVGTLEASRVAGGHLVTSRIEVDGTRGSLQFSMQNLNELRVAKADREFRTVSAIAQGAPYQDLWFPAGHPLGWVDSFAHEALHILGAIGGLHEVAPLGATFRDGYFCAEIIDAILQASREHHSIDIRYRTLGG